MLVRAVGYRIVLGGGIALLLLGSALALVGLLLTSRLTLPEDSRR